MELSKEIETQLNELNDIDKRIEIESQIIERNQLLIAITIDKSIINLKPFEPLDAIRFVLLVKQTYPITPPLLFCITRFCLPELCDCRDLLEDTLQMKWDSDKCFLKLIISQIPSFIQRYILYYKNIENNNNIENINNIENNNSQIFAKRKFFGKYYLDSIYELSIIKYIPYLYFDVISEVVSIEDDNMNIEDRKILITDNFVLLFCNKSLYELDQLKLVFIGPITSLIYIRQFINDGIVLLQWIIKGKDINNNNSFTMQLRTPDGDYIVDTLIDNLSKNTIKFKVTNRVNGNIKREGSVPMIEINLVEEEIKHLEKKIENKEEITKESISILVSLYEKAIQYYSALNDEKFKIFIKKLHNIYSNNEYTSLLNMKTISSAKFQYNVGHFKRKRRSTNGNKGEQGEGKKKKEKKIKKKNDKNNIENKEDKSTNDKNIKNDKKEEDKKEENINNDKNNIINENEKQCNDNEVNKNELNENNKNDLDNNNIKDDNLNNNIINEKQKKNEDNNEIKENRKRNMRKREEESKTFRKNRNEVINNNFIENPKSQRIYIDKKEIEEMIKNELNMKNSIENKEIIKDAKIEEDKDILNKEKGENNKEIKDISNEKKEENN